MEDWGGTAQCWVPGLPGLSPFLLWTSQEVVALPVAEVCLTLRDS